MPTFIKIFGQLPTFCGFWSFFMQIFGADF
nr:MAG TPA: hypothetical protein [Caudoviricetes sp.]